jgi:DNA-directed RNA polymerase I subunit RPA2
MDRRVPSVQPARPIADTNAKIAELALAHVESFNFMLDDGLRLAVEDIAPRELPLSREALTNRPAAAAGEDAPPAAAAAGTKVLRFWLEDVRIGFPAHKHAAADARMFPWQCREAGMTYGAPLTATLCRTVDDGRVDKLPLRLGDAPVMVRSNRCHLAGLSPAELVSRNEEEVEAGGYFICNGIERIIRMLQVPRRNYPMAVQRSAYAKRGPLYSNKAIMMRCVRPDQSGVTITVHYLNDGNARARFSLKKQEFFVPVVLLIKSLVDVSDRELFELIMGGDGSNASLSDAVTLLLRDFKRLGLHSRRACLEYLGRRFRVTLDMPASLSDAAAGQRLMDSYVLVHLGDDGTAKVDLLVIILRKLYAFVAGDVVEDNSDSLMNQEMLLPGHLYLMFIKEKLQVRARLIVCLSVSVSVSVSVWCVAVLVVCPRASPCSCAASSLARCPRLSFDVGGCRCHCRSTSWV